MATHEVIVENAQVLIAPGKKKLTPGLPLEYQLTALRTEKGGVFFDPQGRYPYNEVWTSLNNLQVIGTEPPTNGDTITYTDGNLQLVNPDSGELETWTLKGTATFERSVG